MTNNTLASLKEPAQLKITRQTTTATKTTTTMLNITQREHT
jgi:hypothetical protein